MEQLLKEITETEALLRRRKARYANVIASGGDAPTSELAAIHKLEIQLANVRMLRQSREILGVDAG